MPNRLSKPKRPRDVSEWAHQIVEQSTREAKPTQSVISKVMAEMGRRGGRIGGKRRMETMTAEERSTVASNAAKKRWAKVNGNGSQGASKGK
jgi:hypothetical protein